MDYITNADELKRNIEDEVGCLTVARLVSGRWEQLVYISGLPYFNFNVRPGLTYLIATQGEGSWPGYELGKISNGSSAGYVLTDADIAAPCAVVGQVGSGTKYDIEAWLDDSEFDKVSARFDGDVFMIQVADLHSEWKSGDILRLRFIDRLGGDIIERSIELTGEPVIYLEKENSDFITLPETFALLGNTPNPFNAVTSVNFSIPVDSDVELSIHDINGKMVNRIYSGNVAAGNHSMIWNGKDDSGIDMPTGVYFINLEAGDFKATSRMMLVK